MSRHAFLAGVIMLALVLSSCDTFFPDFGVGLDEDGRISVHTMICVSDDYVLGVRLEDTGFTNWRDLPGKGDVLWGIRALAGEERAPAAVEVGGAVPPGYRLVKPVTVEPTTFPSNHYLRLVVTQTIAGEPQDLAEEFRLDDLHPGEAWFPEWGYAPLNQAASEAVKVCDAVKEYYRGPADPSPRWIGWGIWLVLGAGFIGAVAAIADWIGHQMLEGRDSGPE